VANVRNLLELLRRRLAADADGRQLADLAIDELLRMHELAEQMLDVARPRGGDIRIARPVAVAREVVRLATIDPTTNGRAETTLVADVLGDDTVEAAIAPDALKQVLVNLLQNARDASATKPAARVGIVVTANGSCVAIDLRDDGPGIPAEIRSRVFDPFFTTKDAVHGVGLGLFVAEGLVRTAGGRIVVAEDSSRMPSALASYRGAWFRIELPSPNASPSDHMAPSAPAARGRPSATPRAT
jgi:signal transduction histidine kinase